MKKTQIKDTLRNIWKEKVSFLSIMMIAMIAVTAYLGIIFGSEGLKQNADNFYKRLNFRDIELTSTMLFGEEDLESLRGIEGVEDVEELYLVPAKVENGGAYKSVSVVSLTERINTVEVIEGRLPENPRECAVEQDLLSIINRSIGDEIIVTDAKGNKPEYLLENSYKITGIIHHPDLYAVERQTPGNRYIMVGAEVFDSEALMNSCMKALVRVEKPEGISYLGKDYRDAVSETKGRIDVWNKEKEVERRATIIERLYQESIKPLEDELAEGEKKLAEARKTLDDTRAELMAAQTELEEGKAKLDEAEAELARVEAELEAAYAELVSAENQLAEAKAELDRGNAELVNSYNQAEAAKENVREKIRARLADILPEEAVNDLPWASSSYIDDASDSNLTIRYFYLSADYQPIDLDIYQDVNSFLDAVVANLEAHGYGEEAKEAVSLIETTPIYNRISEVHNLINQWDQGHTQYLDGISRYNAGLAEYNQGLAEYNAGMEQYNAGLAEYNQRMAEYEAARKQIEDGWAELERGEAEYLEGQKKLEDARKEIEKAKAELENMANCHFVALDARGNAGFVHGDDSASNVGKLGRTFAILFIFLGALVIYATVGRIIDEQRTLVGTQKALGFFSSEVFLKHLSFGLIATFIGVLLGVGLGYVLVEKIILYAYQPLYVTGEIPRVFMFKLPIIILVAGLFLAGFAVFWACSHLLRETAKDLMQPPAPKGRNKTETGKKKGSLYSRLIVRNMIMDWRRVAITMISIAGCTILLVIGFTLQDSITLANELQFEEISIFKERVNFDPDASENAKEEIIEALEKEGIQYIELNSNYHSFSSPEGLTAAELIAVDPETIDDFFKIMDVETGEKLTVPEEGVLITKRISETYGLSVGDSFIIYDEGMDPYQVKVAGVFEYYFGKIMVVSREGYEKLFGEAPTSNSIWTRGDYEGKIETKVSGISGVESIRNNEEIKQENIKLTFALTLITFTLILAAGLLAYFVLLNLISMHLNQKKRELTIMRVNGFTTKEVIRYVARENVITTGLGIILGLLVGSVLGYRIICLLEQSQFGLVRSVDLKGWLYSALLTVVFAVVINALAMRKIKYLKLSDVA